MKGLITLKREEFHRILIENNTWAFSRFNKYGETKIASNADNGQKTSVLVSNLLLDKIAGKIRVLPRTLDKKKEGQTVGNEFEAACSWFINETFPKLDHIRPGNWTIEQIKNRTNAALGKYEQYSHLAELNILAKKNKTLRNFLGDGYTVSPDVLISRDPESDLFFNKTIKVVDAETSKNAMLRKENHLLDNPLPILHASISCKFTMRSDRAQNTRTEALNLLRTRKGRAPHIASVTAEPMPSRLASLALGTGDMDYVYHFALYELLEVYEELELDDSVELLTTMIDGKRLKDISDLPLDLIV